MSVAISGLDYFPNFISIDEERNLLKNLDSQEWRYDLKRRVQHYGYVYDYKARVITNSSYIGILPEWISPLAKKLYLEKFFKKIPDQVIVNEYIPGQGIAAHIDCILCFGETIASLSLGSTCVMNFTNNKNEQKEKLFLEERSLVVLSGAARYEWTHEIPARKSDIVNGMKIPRARRVSLTFRTVNLNKP